MVFKLLKVIGIGINWLCDITYNIIEFLIVGQRGDKK